MEKKRKKILGKGKKADAIKSKDSKARPEQENQQQRGYEEDRRHNPLRASNKTPDDQKGRDYTPDTYD